MWLENINKEEEKARRVPVVVESEVPSIAFAHCTRSVVIEPGVEMLVPINAIVQGGRPCVNAFDMLFMSNKKLAQKATLPRVVVNVSFGRSAVSVQNFGSEPLHLFSGMLLGCLEPVMVESLPDEVKPKNRMSSVSAVNTQFDEKEIKSEEERESTLRSLGVEIPEDTMTSSERQEFLATIFRHRKAISLTP